MFPIAVILLIAIVFPGQPLFADPDSLQYQERGNYMEGIRGRLVSGEVIELVSVIAVANESQAVDEPQYRLAFMHQDAVPPHITIRELQFQHGYWLDKVGEVAKPGTVRWEPGKIYEFTWSTKPVIAPKKIRLQDLGVVVRLNSQPGALERVLPAVLYQGAKPAESIQSYAFTFKTMNDARLTCTVVQKKIPRPSHETKLSGCGLIRGNQSHTVTWTESAAEPGWYSLLIEGFQVANNERLEQIVHFYHLGNLPDSPVPIR